MQQVIIKTIDLAALANILADGFIEQQVDTGSSSVITMKHDILGSVTLMTNTLDNMGIIVLSRQAVELLPN